MSLNTMQTQRVHWDLIYALLISVLLHLLIIIYSFVAPRIVGNISSIMPAETRLNATLQAARGPVIPEIIEETQTNPVDEDTSSPVLSTETPNETSVPITGPEEIKPSIQQEAEQEPKEPTLAPPSTDQPQSPPDPAVTTEGNDIHEGTTQLYHDPVDLTVAPTMIGVPSINLPEPIGGGASPTGRLVLKIAISSFGLVDWIEVEQSTLPPVFDAVISNAFRSVLYKPGEIDGKKAASLLFMEVLVDDGQEPVQLFFPPAKENPAEGNNDTAGTTFPTPATPGATQK